MRSLQLISIVVVAACATGAAQPPKSGLTRALEAELDRFPAKAGVARLIVDYFDGTHTLNP
jgi:hypothetical protein